MTEQEQRIAIAEFCGWVGLRLFDDGFEKKPVGFSPSNQFPHDKGEETVPIYLHDLNAIQDAAWTLPKDKRNDYMDYLHDIASMPGDYGWYEANASPSQRAEALLKTIGKWKD